HALNHTTTGRQVTHHVTSIVFRCFDFNSHHGLEQDRAGLAHRFLECHRTGHAERVFVRVDIVVRTEEQRNLDVDHRVARHNTCRQGFLDTFVDVRDVFARNHTALDGVDKLVATARLERFELEHDVTVLAATTRLLDELAFDFFAGFANGFAVGHLRLAHVGFDTEFTTHAVDDDVEVQFAHAGN